MRMRAHAPQENLWLWMADKRGRDQFVVRHADETEVAWNDAARAQPEEVYKRSFWTESFVLWSPHGSYLATMHRQGIALWGGPSFLRLHRFSHPNVRACPSPCQAAPLLQCPRTTILALH
jgi:translation initiation factor 3 subunit B